MRERFTETAGFAFEAPKRRGPRQRGAIPPWSLSQPLAGAPLIVGIEGARLTAFLGVESVWLPGEIRQHDRASSRASPPPLAIELEGLSGIGLEAPFLGVAFAASGGERGASLPANLEPLRAQAIGH